MERARPAPAKTLALGGEPAMLLWSGDPALAPARANVVLWHGPGQRAGTRSLTEFIERHADEIRRRYLAWVHDLGETQVLGRRLSERFRFSAQGSLWAHAAFVEQSTWRQRSLETLLKVFAFDLLLEQERPADVALAGPDRSLGEVLQALCHRRAIRCSRSPSPSRAMPSRRALVRALPRPVHALVRLTQLALISHALRRLATRGAPTHSRRVLICGPFSNHDANRAGVEGFSSRFWGPLPQLLVQAGYEVRWLHYFHAHDELPDPDAARRAAERANLHVHLTGAHQFVEGFVSPPGIVRIFCRWLLIAAESLAVGLALRRRFRRNPQESFWPVIRADWARAFRGADCVESLFYLESFERALRELPRHDEGLYLMENQNWERALARAWHSHGHGRLTGVAHSTVRFWDLRYHCDPRRYDSGWRCHLPAPDVVVVNGREARLQYLATCSNREEVTECEALRYLHLRMRAGQDGTEAGRGAALRLLILGDYTLQRTDAMLQMVRRARPAVGAPLEIWLKAHPACALDPRRYEDMAVKLVGAPISQLLPAVQLVLASNTTSAALEAYVAGARVLVLDDRAGVNYSPLKDVAGVTFIHDADELGRAIESHEPGASDNTRQPAAFFNIDPQLPRWRRYFGVRRPEADAMSAERSCT